MTCVVNLAAIITALLSSVVVSETTLVNIEVVPSLADGPAIWHTDLLVKCSWEANKQIGDILVDGTSAYSSPQYKDMVGQEDPTLRVYLNGTDSPKTGTATLSIKDITLVDEHDFSCFVGRIGQSDTLSVSILEPPTVAVQNLLSVPDYEGAVISFDAVEGATVYVVAYQSDGSSEWDEVETTELSHTLTGLETATGYTVKVTSGNDAGFRKTVLPTEITFKTKDNRPPQAVDDLEVTSAGYNISDVTLTWSLTTNQASTLIVSAITVKVEKKAEDNSISPLSSEEIAGDLLTYSSTLPGPGEYVFTVETKNEFSAGVEGLSREVSHLVKETTEPPTIPPTEPKTDPPTIPPAPKPQLLCSVVIDDSVPDDTEVVSGDETEVVSGDETEVVSGDEVHTDDDGHDHETEVVSGDEVHTDDDGHDHKKRSAYTMGDPIPKEVVADESLSIACYLASGATITSDQILWSYSMPNSEEEVAQGDMSDGISVASAADSSSLTITSASENHQGTYTCRAAEDASSCSFAVAVKTTPKSGASPISILSILSLLTLVLALH